MKVTWSPEVKPTLPAITTAGWIRIAGRGAVWLLILLLGVVVTLAVRVVEWPLWGMRRPWTPYVTQWVCRATFRLLGMTHQTKGQPMRQPGAVVANHSSWLDIFSLNARKRIYFVSKSEVAGWPGIGFLARLTGTVFIARDPRQAKQQTKVFEDRLHAGHKLVFFPEGTSTDGLRVLPFKSTLFQSFFHENLRHEMYIQPVTCIYTAPPDGDDWFYGWWGAMDFAPHLARVLAAPRQGSVTVVYHPPVKVDDFTDRKALARALEDTVRAGMPPERQ